MALPLTFAAVAFLHCALCLISSDTGLIIPAGEDTIDFTNMLIIAFCVVLLTAYPYQMLKPNVRNIEEYAIVKSIIFGCCALPFLALMAYIYQTYGEGWRPVVVENVWAFSMAYVMCCWGFSLFLVTTSYDMCHRQNQ